MRHARGIRLLAIAALVAICCTGTALAARSSSGSHLAGTKLAGKWKGQYSGAVSGHFTLHWTQTGARLSGKITLSNPKGTYNVGGNLKHHTKIKFGAVGVGATYKGTWTGSKMSGTWKSPEGGGSWSAHKVK